MNCNCKSLFLVISAAFLGSAHAQGTAELKTEKEKKSYSIGWNFGSSMKQREVDVDLDVLARGVKDAMAGSKGLLTPEQVRENLNLASKEINTKFEAKRKADAEKNIKLSQSFLEENKKKPGVQTLPDGLQYKVLVEGKGLAPGPTDTVTVNYRGTLIDGTQFDASPPGEPRNFAVNMVIKGWSEALRMMKTGSKWQIFIPPALAYGPYGSSNRIPPNAALIFDVELVATKPPPPPPQLPEPVTSDIIKVPSAEGIKKGEKIEILKPEDVEKEKKKEKKP